VFPSALDFIKIDEVLGSAPLILPHLPKLQIDAVLN